MTEAESVARLFHETYEKLAPTFGYETRKESAVAWDDVPENNRSLMIAVAGEVIAAHVAGVRADQAEKDAVIAETHFPEQGQRAYFIGARSAARAIRRAVALTPTTDHKLTIRPNPPMPSDEELHQLRSDAERHLDDFTAGLRAIWRHGCDTGMVAP